MQYSTPSVALDLGTHPIVASAVFEAEMNTHIPQKMLVIGALSAISAAVAGAVDVQKPTGDGAVWPTATYSATIAGSGEGKSTTDGIFFREHRAIQEEQRLANEAALKEWSARMVIWRTKERVLKRALECRLAEKESTTAEESALCDHLRNEPPRPRLYKQVYEDTTPEALFWGLHTHHSAAALISSEGDVIFNGRVAGALPKLNSLHSGETVTIDRKTGDSYTLVGCRLTIAAMLQPAALARFMATRGEHARGIGHLARYLVCDPGSTQGWRLFHSNPKLKAHQEAFGRRMRVLLEQNLIAEKSGSPARQVLKFSPEAADEWVRYASYVEVQKRPGLRYCEARDHASRLAENAARVAALLHYFEGFEGDISINTLLVAIHICDDLSNDFMRLFVPPAQENVDAKLLNDWLNQRGRSVGLTTLTKNRVRQGGPNLVRDKQRLNDALAVLEAQGFIRQFRKGRTYVIDLFPRTL